ncbi:MAG: DUF3592 domain-containing protein [Candidatus Hodarchaeales archaeon]|jgi:hypothetical protein
MNKIVDAILLLVISYIFLLILVQLQIIHPNGLSASLGYVFIVLTVFPIRFFPEALASRSWPSVEGEITTSEEEKAGSHYRVSLKPKIKYSYSVNGEIYQSRRIKIGAQSISSTDRGWVERTLKRYPLGKKLTVYYNPTLPLKTVLEPGFNLRIYSFVLIGLVFYAFSWLIGYVIAKSGGL